MWSQMELSDGQRDNYKLLVVNTPKSMTLQLAKGIWTGYKEYPPHLLHPFLSKPFQIQLQNRPWT